MYLRADARKLRVFMSMGCTNFDFFLRQIPHVVIGFIISSHFGSVWCSLLFSGVASVTAQEWSWHTFPGPQTCRIHIPLPYHELGLPNIDPNNEKGSY